MQGTTIRRLAITLGAVATLALGTGSLFTAPRAYAAPAADHHDGDWWRHERHEEHERFERGEHRFWGRGFHHAYPQFYVRYLSEPVQACALYYFEASEGAWYCYVGD